MPREPEKVKQCEESEKVWYGLWSTEHNADQAMAFSSFNPSFDQLANEIKNFVSTIRQEQ